MSLLSMEKWYLTMRICVSVVPFLAVTSDCFFIIVNKMYMQKQAVFM